MKYKFLIFLICILFVIAVVYCIYLFIPIKYTINEINTDNKEYYICKYVYFPGATYYIKESMPDTSVEFLNADKEINLFRQEEVDNRFVLYGKSHIVRNELVDGEVIDLDLEDFDILYPFQRNGILSRIIPSNYICRYDLSNHSKMYKGDV